MLMGKTILAYRPFLSFHNNAGRAVEKSRRRENFGFGIAE
jgi:hypothetical protein